MKRKSLVAYGHTQDLPASTLRNLLQSKPLPGPGLETIFQPRMGGNHHCAAESPTMLNK